MTKRKLKKMICDLDTTRKLRGVFGDKIMNDITIIDNKIFVTTTDEEVRKNGRQNKNNV